MIVQEYKLLYYIIIFQKNEHSKVKNKQWE